jgi:hypothetical protein
MDIICMHGAEQAELSIREHLAVSIQAPFASSAWQLRPSPCAPLMTALMLLKQASVPWAQALVEG